jgi:acylphosphatase
MTSSLRQVQVLYEGAVQGVGFRYTVTRIAQRLDVAGSVANLPDGTVHLTAEAPEDTLRLFLDHINASRLRDYITAARVRWHPPQALTGFHIR